MANIMTKQLRRWCMTIWLDKTPDGWDMPTELPEKVRLLAWNHEQTEDGKEHFQAYIAMLQGIRPNELRKLLKMNKTCCHFEPANGTEEENLKYCSKEDSRVPGSEPQVLGRVQKAGQRTDLERAAQTLREGGLKRVATDHFSTYVKYNKGLEAYLRIMAEDKRDRSIEPEVTVFWGNTGTGKSKKAFEIAEESEIPYYVKDGNHKWWDGYMGEKLCIIDEYVGQIELGTFLRWLDRYPMPIEVKGGMTQLQVTKWIITSNLHPDEWYLKASLEHKAALRRRLTNVVQVTGDEMMGSPAAPIVL